MVRPIWAPLGRWMATSPCARALLPVGVRCPKGLPGPPTLQLWGWVAGGPTLLVYEFEQRQGHPA
jgi:hypothetical protein